MFDTQGRFRGYRGIGKDITEHKQEQQRQAIEHAVAQILSDADALSEAVPRIIQSVCGTMGWDYGARWQHGAHNQSYTCAELWCRPELRDSEFIAWTHAKRIRAAGQGLVRHVLETGESSWITDIAADSRSGARSGSAQVRAHGCLRLPHFLR